MLSFWENNGGKIPTMGLWFLILLQFILSFIFASIKWCFCDIIVGCCANCDSHTANNYNSSLLREINGTGG